MIYLPCVCWYIAGDQLKVLGVRMAFAVIAVFVDDNVLSWVSECAMELPLAVQALFFTSDEAFFLCIKDRQGKLIIFLTKLRLIAYRINLVMLKVE